jgi:hypothetical protein
MAAAAEARVVGRGHQRRFQFGTSDRGTLATKATDIRVGEGIRCPSDYNTKTQPLRRLGMSFLLSALAARSERSFAIADMTRSHMSPSPVRPAAIASCGKAQRQVSSLQAIGNTINQDKSVSVTQSIGISIFRCGSRSNAAVKRCGPIIEDI